MLIMALNGSLTMAQLYYIYIFPTVLQFCTFDEMKIKRIKKKGEKKKFVQNINPHRNPPFPDHDHICLCNKTTKFITYLIITHYRYTFFFGFFFLFNSLKCATNRFHWENWFLITSITRTKPKPGVHIGICYFFGNIYKYTDHICII